MLIMKRRRMVVMGDGEEEEEGMVVRRRRKRKMVVRKMKRMALSVAASVSLSPSFFSMEGLVWIYGLGVGQ
jgi:hypothetical protein